MKRHSVLVIAYLIILCILLVNSACASIPAGVKDNYSYGVKDSSIMPVKQRLKELGYLSEKAAVSEWLDNSLKNAIIAFKKRNDLKSDSTINKECNHGRPSGSDITSCRQMASKGRNLCQY